MLGRWVLVVRLMYSLITCSCSRPILVHTASQLRCRWCRRCRIMLSQPLTNNCTVIHIIYYYDYQMYNTVEKKYVSSKLSHLSFESLVLTRAKSITFRFVISNIVCSSQASEIAQKTPHFFRQSNHF